MNTIPRDVAQQMVSKLDQGLVKLNEVKNLALCSYGVTLKGNTRALLAKAVIAATEPAPAAAPKLTPAQIATAEVKAKQAKELAQIEAKYDFAAHLPVTPWFVLLKTNSGLPWDSAHIKVNGLRGALEVLKQFTVIPFTEFRNGYVRLQPMELVPADQRDKYVGNRALSIDVSTHFFSHCGAGTTVKVGFFARVPSLPAPSIVHIVLDVEGPGYIGSFMAFSATARFDRREVIRGSVRRNEALDGVSQKYIHWSSGSDDYANFAYLINADYADSDATADDLTHAYTVLRDLSAEFDKKETI